VQTFSIWVALNLLETSFCVQNIQVFGLYMLNYQKVLAFFHSNRKALELMTNFTTRYHWFFSSLLATILYHGNPDWKHKFWNIVSTERYILHIQVLLEYCYIWMESSEWKNCNHLFYHRRGFVLNWPYVSISRFVKVWMIPSCICGKLYFKLNGIDVINNGSQTFAKWKDIINMAEIKRPG
jgi:hypothetical protein